MDKQIDKQIEYEIRTDMYNLNNRKIEEEFNKLECKLINFSKYELICYSLVSIENGFKAGIFNGDITYKDAGSKRTVLEWFLKKLLNNEIDIKEFKFDKVKYNEFESYLPEIGILCVNYLRNKQLNEKRGINKIRIVDNGKNEYTFELPEIKNDMDCQDTYYWEKNIDSSQIEKEASIKGETIKKIFDKYGLEKNIDKTNYTNFRNFLSLKEKDLEIYDTCKDNVKVDVDKMGMDFSSELIKNKQQLINIIAVFMYISIIYTVSTVLDLQQDFLFKMPIIYHKEELIEIIKSFLDITYDEVNKIINYFTIDSKLIGGINEYPLVNIKDNVLWIPSSFIMNDFQFSIVNGHYEKSIKINNRAETVSQSVVDDIVNECKKYKNIVISMNKVYSDKFHKFKGGDLESDIDVALYDEIYNSLLIIECKWKEDVFLKGERYDQICDAVNHIFNKQLDKHRYFLELNEKNLDFIFDNNERVRNRPYFPQVLYIFVDKRIHYHYEGRHALSEFNLLKIFKDNSYNNILRLDKVNSYIKTLNTKVEHIRNNEISQIKLNGRLIKNNLFTLKY